MNITLSYVRREHLPAFEINFILKGFVMRKKIALLLAAIMLLSLAACGGKPSESNENSLAVCLASEPDTIDRALTFAVDGATMLAHLFSGLAKWSQDKDGNLQIVADAATELAEGVINDDGTVTYTYTLRDNLKWSDGKPVTAGDFVFAWNRAASFELAADYGYMFENVKGYAEIWETKPVLDDNGQPKVDEKGNTVEEPVNPDAKLAV